MAAFSSKIRDFLAAPEDARRLGPFRCKDLLDKAGAAPVYRAVEEHGGMHLRDVAVKVFDMQARVVDEARSLCKVQHPNVIRFHTLATDSKRGLMGLVMEFADGISVERELADLPPGDARRMALAVEIGLDIASALAAVHEAGVVHCNVKPSNIVLTNGTHKLINFGIAAAVRPGEQGGGANRESLAVDDLPPESIGTQASTLDKEAGAPLTGTIGYVDPVCVKTTSPPTPASDLYSLGATLYQCIAGDVPALATSKKAVDKKVLVGDAPPVPLADVAPSAPADLAKLVDALVAPTREARPRSADVVVRALERIRSTLAGRDRSLPPEDRGPFPGLERYEASDRDVFFGRTAEIAGVIELFRTRGLVGIVGLSGSGKSSITRAGLLPAIEEGALGGWPKKYRSVLVTPGSDLMASLDKALVKLTGAPLAEHPEAIAEQLAEDVDAKGEGIVILVDQLEEIVTKYDEKNAKGRASGLDLLSRLAEAHAGVRVLVAVRRDLLDGTLAIDPHFSRALSRGIQLLGPLTRGQWEEAIDRSLEAYGYHFENAEVRTDLFAELAGLREAMTLVQFGLARLWGARDAKKKLIPRVEGAMTSALEEHANGAILDKKIPKDTLRGVLLAMTTPEGTRDHVELDALVKRHGDLAKDAIFALTKARLVVAEKDGFTFVHDAVLREWGLLRGFIDDAKDDRLLVAHVERDAAPWAESSDPAALWRKGRLAAAIELWKRDPAQLSETARRFIAASAKEAQKAERVRFAVFTLIAALIVGSALVYAKTSKDAAEQARRDAVALAAAKQQAEEAAGEAAATAALLHDAQQKLADEEAAYSANLAATKKKVAAATSLDGAQKATADLNAPNAVPHPVVPLPANLLGPSIPSPGGPGPSGGGAFDQSAIERVVNSRKAGVKRTCLERSSSTASTTKVTATITIAPNGSVQNVSTAGDDPTVAKCIEQQLRTWAFPAPGDTKQVQIPFVFVRQ